MLDEIVSEFLVESYESLDQLDRNLMALDETPYDRNRMTSLFHTIYTIQGTSGFLALPTLKCVTHVSESLLDGCDRAGAFFVMGFQKPGASPTQRPAEMFLQGFRPLTGT